MREQSRFFNKHIEEAITEGAKEGKEEDDVPIDAEDHSVGFNVQLTA